MQLRGAHLLLKFRLHQNVAQNLVGCHQAVAIADQHVVHAHDVVVAQFRVVHLEATGVHRIVQREMHVVVKNRASGDDPVHESRFDQRHDGRAAQARRRQRAGKAHADGYVGIQHLLAEKLAALAETRAIVGQKRVVDDVRKLLLARQILGKNTRASQVFVAVRALLFLHPFRHFGHVFAIAAVFVVLAMFCFEGH